MFDFTCNQLFSFLLYRRFFSCFIPPFAFEYLVGLLRVPLFISIGVKLWQSSQDFEPSINLNYSIGCVWVLDLLIFIKIKWGCSASSLTLGCPPQWSQDGGCHISLMLIHLEWYSSMHLVAIHIQFILNPSKCLTVSWVQIWNF